MSQLIYDSAFLFKKVFYFRNVCLFLTLKNNGKARCDLFMFYTFHDFVFPSGKQNHIYFMWFLSFNTDINIKGFMKYRLHELL